MTTHPYPHSLELAPIVDLFSGEGVAAIGYSSRRPVISLDSSLTTSQKYSAIHAPSYRTSSGRHTPAPRLSKHPHTVLEPQNALSLLADLEFISMLHPAFIHTSPPCQFYSVTAATNPNALSVHPDLIPETRRLLLIISTELGIPWVIENVPSSRHNMHPDLVLCGTMFDLRAKTSSSQLYLRRHRVFEFDPVTSDRLASYPSSDRLTCICQRYDNEGLVCAGVYGWGSGQESKDERRGGYVPSDRLTREKLMGIPKRYRGLFTLTGLNQGIPPAYARYVATQILG